MDKKLNAILAYIKKEIALLKLGLKQIGKVIHIAWLLILHILKTIFKYPFPKAIQTLLGFIALPFLLFFSILYDEIKKIIKR